MIILPSNNDNINQSGRSKGLNLFNKIILNKLDFFEEMPLNKIKLLLNANSDLLTKVGDFIKQSKKLQK
jgi:hypothetical protein